MNGKNAVLPALALSLGLLGIGSSAELSAAPAVLMTRTVVVNRPMPVRSATARVPTAIALASLPRNHVRVVHVDRNYYIADGLFYVRQGRGYVLSTPVAGVTVASLPRGFTTLRRNGQVFYRYSGISYRRVANGFVVV